MNTLENKILNAEQVSVWYKDFLTLKNISIPIYANKITALIGASGSGKSTFLRCLNRMVDTTPHARTEGRITFGEYSNILDANLDVVALRREIGMVFQNPTPFPKSIFDNVSYGLEIQGMKKEKHGSILSRIFGNGKISGEQAENSSNEITKVVVNSLKKASLWDEVKDRLGQSAYSLSGGQQQRLCIARALATKPKILLLDEPCSELDPISTQHIEGLLLDLKKHYTIVIVTHNLHQARRISDYISFFHLGELIEYGDTQKVFNYPKHELTNNYTRGHFG